MKLQYILLLLSGALLVTTTCLAGINKCVIDGKVVYTDQACPENTSQEVELDELVIMPAGDKEPYQSSVWFKDHSGYARALKLQQSVKVPIFIYGYTDWCGYCRKLEQDYFSDYDIKQALSGLIKVQLNPEHSAKDKQLFKSWGGTGYPTVMIQMDEKQKPKRVSRPSSRQGANKANEKAKFIKRLNGLLASIQPPTDLNQPQ